MQFNKEKMQEILEGVELEEGTVDKLVNLVESSITDKLAAQAIKHSEQVESLKESAEEFGRQLKENHQQEIEELKESAQRYGDFITEEVVNKVGEYADYSAQEFVKENKEKFEKLENFERIEEAFSHIKEAFQKNGFVLDHDAEVEAKQAELEESKVALNEMLETLNETKQELETAKMALIFEDLTKDLAETQKESVKELSESVEFDGIDEFKAGISLLIEQAKKPSDTKDSLNEDMDNLGGAKKEWSPTMKAVLENLR